MNEQITVLADESLGGLLREYREVKRKAAVGERIKFNGFDRGFNMDGVENPYEVGEVLLVSGRYDHRPFPEDAIGACVTGRPNIRDSEYVVLEPTEIIRIDGARFRIVDRKAAVGDRVLVPRDCGRFYKAGNVARVRYAYDDGAVSADFSGNSYVYNGGVWHVGGDIGYRVLEPVKSEEDVAPMPLSTRPAPEQAAENIASLQAQISALESRVAALEKEQYNTPKLTVIPPQKSPKTPQQIRDELVERAKADVKALSETPLVPIENSCGRIGFWPYVEGGGESYMPIDFVEFHVNREKRTVVALIRSDESGVWLRGRSICAPNDVFNAHIGRAIALRRALGLEVPAEYLSVPAPMEVRVGDIVKATGSGAYLPGTTGVCVSLDAEDGGLLYAHRHDGRRDGNTWAFEEDVSIIDDTREGAELSASSSAKGVAA
ncbi:hypothetical protein DFP94_101512 [Fontibacillus phaseoli]|uniref:Uncharacterized protein n=1 Tax=Fontibacillus phaseoli TaxID=1416533 RepID=A0A369BMZ3_9BACL|nr:hypothetical protein [Fontibacillus phaseoli]RCX22923.1 hypothetical protein DFP94_101512 [Fontibacillus phaseoli]